MIFKGTKLANRKPQMLHKNVQLTREPKLKCILSQLKKTLEPKYSGKSLRSPKFYDHRKKIKRFPIYKKVSTITRIVHLALTVWYITN